MNTNKWITDREPTIADACRINATHLADEELYGEVWVWRGQYLTMDWELVKPGTPWQPIIPPEPYVMPKRYNVKQCNLGGYDVHCDNGLRVAMNISTREAAEEIAAIYERVTS